MKPIFAIDPGDTQSAYVVYCPKSHKLIHFGKLDNLQVKEILIENVTNDWDFCIEMIASYGMPVGKNVFETCVWIGRFSEVIQQSYKLENLVYRKDVKMNLCGSMRAKDSNIRQSIIDLFPPEGGGKTPQIGTKSSPGPLYGVSKDVWAAIGVALTFHEKRGV